MIQAQGPKPTMPVLRGLGKKDSHEFKARLGDLTSINQISKQMVGGDLGTVLPQDLRASSRAQGPRPWDQ